MDHPTPVDPSLQIDLYQVDHIQVAAEDTVVVMEQVVHILDIDLYQVDHIQVAAEDTVAVMEQVVLQPVHRLTRRRLPALQRVQNRKARTNPKPVTVVSSVAS